MNRHERLESLFLECAALPPADREAFLDVRCAGDPDLKAEVLDLLDRDADPDTPTLTAFVAPPGPAFASAPPALPERIGPYRIVRRLGEGGFGEVFEGRQEQPVRRRVALKVLKRGMDTRAVLARFAAERQALALMDHPGVARVLDAGETESGQPYFAMELVHGEPITAWCDRTRADHAARVELMIAVCRAVEHAHQKGVIHRDLKPSNILVAESDGRPLPKVIDFGIAKATIATFDTGSLFTRPGEFLGTPEYMSPEQATSGGIDVDTRTDVYSLGVVLYQLLTGRLPFDSERLHAGGLDEARRILREEEPPRPSTLGAGARTLRGDLDWIILRAMEKERSRRYASPAALADDLARHLRDEPVLAGPPTPGYRLRKFARRRRGAVIAAAAVLLVVTAGIVVATVQAIRVARAEAEARRQAATATEVNQFLIGMLGAGNPESNPGAHLVTVREVAERAAADLADSTFADPAVEAGIRGALANTFLGLGLYDAAVPQAERALALTERTVDPSSPLAIDRHVVLARARAMSGDREATEAILAAIAPRVEGSSPRERSVYLTVRGGNLVMMNRLVEADSFLTQAVEGDRALFRSDPAFRGRLVTSLTGLSELKGRRGMRQESEALALEAVEVARSRGVEDHHDVAMAINHLGSVHRRMGRYASAESLYRASIAIDQRAVGPGHPYVGITLSNLGLVLVEMGRPGEAEAAHREALANVTRATAGDHAQRMTVMNNLATSIQAQGRLDEALAIQLDVLAMSRRLNGRDVQTAVQLNNVASIYRLQKRYAEAGPLFLAADSIFVATLGAAHPQSITARYNYGKILLDQGRAREAEPHMREAARRAATGLPAGHPSAAVIASGLGHATMALGRTAEADSLLRSAHTTLSAALGPGHERARWAAEGLVATSTALGRPDEARRWRAAAAPPAAVAATPR